MGICKRGPSPSAQDRRPAIAAVMDVPDVAAVRPNPPEMQPERRKCGVGGGRSAPSARTGCAEQKTRFCGPVGAFRPRFGSNSKFVAARFPDRTSERRVVGSRARARLRPRAASDRHRDDAHNCSTTDLGRNRPSGLEPRSCGQPSPRAPSNRSKPVPSDPLTTRCDRKRPADRPPTIPGHLRVVPTRAAGRAHRDGLGSASATPIDCEPRQSLVDRRARSIRFRACAWQTIDMRRFVADCLPSGLASLAATRLKRAIAASPPTRVHGCLSSSDRRFEVSDVAFGMTVALSSMRAFA